MSTWGENGGWNPACVHSLCSLDFASKKKGHILSFIQGCSMYSWWTRLEREIKTALSSVKTDLEEGYRILIYNQCQIRFLEHTLSVRHWDHRNEVIGGPVTSRRTTDLCIGLPQFISVFSSSHLISVYFHSQVYNNLDRKFCSHLKRREKIHSRLGSKVLSKWESVIFSGLAWQGSWWGVNGMR